MRLIWEPGKKRRQTFFPIKGKNTCTILCMYMQYRLHQKSKWFWYGTLYNTQGHSPKKVEAYAICYGWRGGGLRIRQQERGGYGKRGHLPKFLFYSLLSRKVFKDFFSKKCTRYDKYFIITNFYFMRKASSYRVWDRVRKDYYIIIVLYVAIHSNNKLFGNKKIVLSDVMPITGHHSHFYCLFVIADNFTELSSCFPLLRLQSQP